MQVVVRMQPPALAMLDSWIARQGDEPSRPEAIRRLVELGLKDGGGDMANKRKRR